MFDYQHYLVSDPTICHGQLVFKDTRIMVYLILEAMAEGSTEEEILTEYPTLTKEHLRAAIAYSAQIVKEETYMPFAI